MTDESVFDAAAALLKQLDIGGLSRVESLPGGRNNRTFRLSSARGQWLLKQYFRDPEGGRDRCASEWAWTSFCWERGIACGPQPLARDINRHCALFDFINGRHLTRDEIDDRHVAQAADFVAEVNRHRAESAAIALPMAAEACLSWQDHVTSVERRMQRLRSLAVRDTLDTDLQCWISEQLEPLWRRIDDSLRQSNDAEQFTQPLPTESRCLSPSDFGFHNALLMTDGRLRFVDFEYAGWDDPAKLVCDFYWQQELPAPRQTRPKLIAALAEGTARQALKERVSRLFPLHGIKWCCLLLNEFLAEHRQRREFAGAVDSDRRAEQLAAAQRLLIDVRSRLP